MNTILLLHLVISKTLNGSEIEIYFPYKGSLAGRGSRVNKGRSDSLLADPLFPRPFLSPPSTSYLSEFGEFRIGFGAVLISAISHDFSDFTRFSTEFN